MKPFLAAMLGAAAMAVPASLADTVADTPEAAVPATYLNYTPQHMLANVDMDDEEDLDDEVEEAAPTVSDNKVAKALRKAKWFNSKPSKDAEYYIYLQSASWCGPCRAEMPTIAKEYKAMREDGRVELVLLSGDDKKKAALAFLKHNKAKFPGTMRKGKGVADFPGADKLPGFFPAAVIVRADGTVIQAGHGSIIRNWRALTIEAN